MWPISRGSMWRIKEASSATRSNSELKGTTLPVSARSGRQIERVIKRFLEPREKLFLLKNDARSEDYSPQCVSENSIPRPFSNFPRLPLTISAY